jgi:predicted transcriptional regulator
MYIHRVHRTQLYLDRELHARLTALAKRRGRTVSELVRHALELVYGSGQTEERIATLRGIAGLWQGRKDLGDTDGYVRRLRRDTRRGRRSRS